MLLLLSRSNTLRSCYDQDKAQFARLLLVNKADTSIADHMGGDTPLHDAASQGRADCVKLLLEHKADLSSLNRDGRTPLECAKARGRQSCVEALKRASPSLS